MTMHSVKIKMHGPGRGTVELDGKPVPACTAFECIGRVGEANVLKLTLLVKDVEIEGVYDVTSIQSEAREFEKLKPLQAEEGSLHALAMRVLANNNWNLALAYLEKASPGVCARVGLKAK